jgi:protein gp37
VTGRMKVSEGCDDCYAETFAEQVAQGSLSSG